MIQHLPGPNNASQPARLFFYFVFVYVALYVFPFPLDLLVSIIQRFFSWINELTGWGFLKAINNAIDTFFGWWNDFWKWMVPAFAKHVLGIRNPISTLSNGSGDTTYAWVSALVNVILAIAGATIWMLVGKRKDYSRLYQFLLMIMRYFLAYMMLNYGFAKVIQSQFPYPYLARLIQPYGESSPMGLAWTFMGYSYGYNLFTGSCEIIGGLLLCFRRTQTFGALFTMTVCVTIFIMNMCFDIPVKLFSFHLLLFATYIAANDFKRLVAFFFTNNPVQLYQAPYYFAGHKWAKKLVWLKWVIILFLVYINYADTKKGYNEYGDGAVKPPLYGIYNAEYKIVNNDTVPLVYHDTTNWKQLIIGAGGRSRVRLLNDSSRRYVFEVDSANKSILFFPQQDTTIKYHFTYVLNKDMLTMAGRIKTDSVVMQFRRYDESKFLLNSRGFHWINENPYNK